MSLYSAAVLLFVLCAVVQAVLEMFDDRRK